MNYDIVEEHYKKHHKKLKQRYSRLAGSPESSADVVQEAYTRALKYISSFDTSGNFEFWFSRILQNSLRDFKKYERGLPTEEYEEEFEEGIPFNGFNKVLMTQIKREISNYSQQSQEVLSLYFNRGFSARDISKIIDINKKAAELVIYRFKSYIKEKYGDQLGE